VAVFQWTGIDAKGKDVKGVRDADNPKILRVLLKKDGILATAIEEEHVAQARARSAGEVDFARMFERVSTDDIALLTRQLATLLHSGVPLVESLSALIEQVDKPALQSALTQIRDRVNEGTSFAEALQGHPKIFEALYYNMVAAGEASGTLDTVLDRLADHLDASSALRGKVIGALAYPAVMLLFTVTVVGFMMVVVVPQVTGIFEDFDQVLPWYTRLLIFISNTITDYWWLLFGLFGGAVWGFVRWIRTDSGRAVFDARILQLPQVGDLVMLIAVARFSRTLATLLASGVSLLTALDITKRVLGNVELMGVIEDARESIREGESIAAPLKRSGKFPPIVTHMIAIGERSGQLEAMLEHVAVAYDNQVSVRVNTLTSLLEPVMIIVMGIIVGSIAMSILMPMMQMSEFIG